jgi:hypothetical protein
MREMKTIRLGNLDWSKVICGSNPFNARSHFSAARDAEYRARFTDEKIERVLRRCLELGINTYETSASERAWNIVSRIRQASGRPLHFIGSTRLDETSDMKSHTQKLEFLVQRKTELCVIHAQHVEKQWKGGTIPGLATMLDAIHAAGLLAGVSAHRIATVELCEKNGYAIDTYLFPLNLSGFVYPGYDGGESPQQRADLVRGLSRPVILMKTLGAGRIPPKEGLQFIAEHAKPTDLISIGFGSIDELEETVQIVEKEFPE